MSKTKQKGMEDVTFAELHREYVAHIMTKLIEEGGKGFSSAVWLAMAATCQWKEAYDKKGRKA